MLLKVLGDPMMAAAAGLVDGLLNKKTMLAGGTQMVSGPGRHQHLGLVRDVFIATTPIRC